MRTIIRPVLALALLLVAAAACGGGGDATDTPSASSTPTPAHTVGLPNPPGNLLKNPGFEEGSEPWISLDPESSFELSPDAAFTGTTSALLHMDDGPQNTGHKVYYLVQEIAPAQFPEMLKGAYRVINWEKGTAKQYLQVVVIAIGADNNPTPAQNFQIRCILAGVSEPPLQLGNAKYRFFSDKEPIQGGWLGFETNVKDDFQQEWGVVPQNFEKIRVLFEVRYDEKTDGDGHSTADVFYDDLYLGSAE